MLVGKLYDLYTGGGMSKVKSLYEIAEQVKRSGSRRTLSREEVEKFQDRFAREISPVIEAIREQERRAHEEAKNFIVA